MMVQSSDHVTALTGASPTVTLSKNGGVFASPSGTVSEIGSGWYKVAGNATDSNTLGPLILHATAASGDPADALFTIIGADPFDGVRMGMTALPNAAAAASGGLLTAGTGSNQLNTTSGGVDVRSILGTASAGAAGYVALDFAQVLPTTTVANSLGEAFFIADNLCGRTGTAQGGTSTTVQLDASASANANSYIGFRIQLIGGTAGGVRGVGAGRTVIAYNPTTKTVTVDYPFGTIPDNTTKFILYYATKADVYMVGSTLQTAGDLYGYLTANLGALGANLTAVPALVWGAATSGITAVGSIGKRLLDFVTTLVYTTAPTAVSVRQEIDANSTQLGVIASATSNLAPAYIALVSQASNVYDVTLTLNGAEITTGITSPTITVITSGGATLISGATLTQVVGGKFTFTATGGQVATSGQSLFVSVSATYSAAVRTFAAKPLIAQ